MVRSFEEGRSSTEIFRTASASAEVFLEAVVPPTRLVIFGAGHDAIPLARIARELGFTTTLVDHRPGHANHERFPNAETILIGRPETVDLAGHIDRKTTAVIMSHSYLIDQQWLKLLLPSGLRYLGMMGPRKRAEKMIQELRGEGLEFTENCFETFHNPVGLDIGAQSPEQIALGILGEIQATLSGHAGGSLRDKKGPIHAPKNRPFGEPTVLADREEISCLA
jgi:xanthine dehydrogenase accessory factor